MVSAGALDLHGTISRLILPEHCADCGCSFETPAICEEVIANFSGQPIGTEGAVLNIRYADTENQKILKSKTAKSRQFKTDEYNAAVYAPQSPYNMVSPSNGVFPSPMNGGYPSPLQIRLPNPLSYWQNSSPVSPV